MFDRQSLQRKPYTYSSRNSGRSPVAMFASGCNHRGSATERTSAWPADVHASMRQPDGRVRRIRHAWEGRTRSLPCRTQDQTPANEHIGPKPDDSAPHRTAPHRTAPRRAAPRGRGRGMAWAAPARFGELGLLSIPAGYGGGQGTCRIDCTENGRPVRHERARTRRRQLQRVRQSSSDRSTRSRPHPVRTTRGAHPAIQYNEHTCKYTRRRPSALERTCAYASTQTRTTETSTASVERAAARTHVCRRTSMH